MTPSDITTQKEVQMTAFCKMMASLFWDEEGILFVDFLEKGTTINSEWYKETLNKRVHTAHPTEILEDVIHSTTMRELTPLSTRVKQSEKLDRLFFPILPTSKIWHPPTTTCLPL
jgi:hypothetical protein